MPRPVGPQTILYGDKIINVFDQRRHDVWPKPETEAYIANGDIGIVVGEYKTRKFRSLPRKLEIEFAGQLGHKYGFWPGEFGDDGANLLELAYCLTVHKTQGSEVRHNVRGDAESVLAAVERASLHGAHPAPEQDGHSPSRPPSPSSVALRTTATRRSQAG